MLDIQKIKAAFYEEGLSKNKISQKFQCSWDTVNRIINTPMEEIEEKSKKVIVGNRKPTVGTQEVKDAIRTLLLNEKEHRIKKKQRLIGKTIYNELVKEGLYFGSYRRLQELIKKEKQSLNISKQKSYLPLHFPLGSCLQIDHGEVECEINGIVTLCYLFVASVPGVSIRYCQIFPCKSREAWGEFHERTFKIFKGIFPKVVYDNDTVLICEVHIKMRTEFGIHLVEHYKFVPHFCNPAAGNEKGTVENGVGYCRRNYFPGRPKFYNFDIANEMCESKFHSEIAGGKNSRTGQALKEIFDQISNALMPLLPSKLWSRRTTRIVDSYQLVDVEKHYYSVPEKYVGKQVTVLIMSFWIVIQCDGTDRKNIDVHVRQLIPGEDSIQLDHYLEPLQKKPGALWDCKATKGLLEDPLLDQAWQLTLKNRSDREARKTFIDILFLRRKYEENQWREALKMAIDSNRVKREEIAAFLDLGLKFEENPQASEEKLPDTEAPSSYFSFDSYSDLCGEEEDLW